LRVLSEQQVDPAGELRALREQFGVSLNDHVGEARPVLIVAIDDDRHFRVLADVADALEPLGLLSLRLRVDGRVERVAVDGVAEWNDERLARRIRGAESAHARFGDEPGHRCWDTAGQRDSYEERGALLVCGRTSSAKRSIIAS